MPHNFDSFHLGFARSQEKLEEAGTQRFVELFRHGPVSLELYAPRKVDTQQAHQQDEIYVVVSGTGEFINGPRRRPFGPGDAMFVPAGVVHRFENFTDDFTVWVVFCGPPGGHMVEK